jgi:hypothetical protein
MTAANPDAASDLESDDGSSSESSKPSNSILVKDVLDFETNASSFDSDEESSEAEEDSNCDDSSSSDLEDGK